MLSILKKPRSFSWLGGNSFFPIERRLVHTTPNVLADLIEQVKRKEREVMPSPLLPKLKMEPFVKNLFVGKFDTNVLTYPEFDLGRLNVVEDMAGELQKFLNGLDSLESSGKQQTTSELISKLKDTGIFGVNVSGKFGGGELSCMEINRLGEVLVSDFSLYQTLNVHISFISEIFSRYASEEQKEQYLPLLASGELQCAVAIWEKDAGVDISEISCSAVMVDGTYKISGSKLWVNNLGFADKILVFAKTADPSNPKDLNVCCLLVDRHSPGITAKRMDTVGANGFDLWEVIFDRTPVPDANLIGDVTKGFDMINSILHGNFTTVGAAYSSILKRMMDIVVEHVTFKNVFSRPLKDFEIVQHHLCDLACLIYTLDSMSYLTANFFDDYENPDCAVEVAIVQLFASQALTTGFNICSLLLGSQVFTKNGPWDQLYRDILFPSTVEFSADYLRLFISSSCLQHVFKTLGSTLKKQRQPFFHPKVAMKGLVNFFNQSTDIPMIPKAVSYHLHPNLERESEVLELCVSHLQNSSHEAILKYGAELSDKHADLGRIADMALDCFAVTAVLARASRSVCIGLRNCDEELALAQRITEQARRRILATSEVLALSPYANLDKCARTLSDTLVNRKGYKLSHPLARNY